MKIIEAERTGRRGRFAASKRRYRRLKSYGSGTITLEGGEALVVLDTTKGFPSSDTTIQSVYTTDEGNKVLVTEEGNIITCQDADKKDLYPNLKPEWLTARLMRLEEQDQNLGYDKSLNKEGNLPARTAVELGIDSGQIWVKREEPLIEGKAGAAGYPYILRVDDTGDYDWIEGVRVGILAPIALKDKSFVIKPSFLLDIYEIYLNNIDG